MQVLSETVVSGPGIHLVVNGEDANGFGSAAVAVLGARVALALSVVVVRDTSWRNLFIFWEIQNTENMNLNSTSSLQALYRKPPTGRS